MSSTRQGKLNIIILVADALRARNLGCYGNPLKPSPTIDELAKKGVLFENAYSTTNHTDPSFTTILSGKHPYSHGIIHHGEDIKKEEIEVFKKTGTKLLPEILKEYGYFNIGIDWLSRWHKNGFDFYGDSFSEMIKGESKNKRKLSIKKLFSLNVSNVIIKLPYPLYIRLLNAKTRLLGRSAQIKDCEKYINTAMILIDKNITKENYFFLLMHFWDTHTPFYELPLEYKHKFDVKKKKPVNDLLHNIRHPKWRENVRKYHLLGVNYKEEIEAFYNGSIYYLDQQIKRLVEFLKEKDELKNTLIIVTGDHGDNFFRGNDYIGHFGLYEDVIKIPFIMYQPKILPRGRRISELIQHTDIVPTILDLAEINTPDFEFDGISLLSLINKEKEISKRSVYFMDAACEERIGVRNSTHKYLLSLSKNPCCKYGIGFRNKEELYDLENDRLEEKNLINKKNMNKIIGSLKKELLDWRATKLMKRRRLTRLKTEEKKRIKSRIKEIKKVEMLKSKRE